MELALLCIIMWSQHYLVEVEPPPTKYEVIIVSHPPIFRLPGRLAKNKRIGDQLQNGIL